MTWLLHPSVLVPILSFVIFFLMIAGLLRIPTPTPGNEEFVAILSRLFLFLGWIVPVVFTAGYTIGFARKWKNAPLQSPPAI